MNGGSTTRVKREHNEWRHEGLAAEVRDDEASGRRVERDADRLQARLHEIGADFGLFRR